MGLPYNQYSAIELRLFNFIINLFVEIQSETEVQRLIKERYHFCVFVAVHIVFFDKCMYSHMRETNEFCNNK